MPAIVDQMTDIATRRQSKGVDRLVYALYGLLEEQIALVELRKRKNK